MFALRDTARCKKVERAGYSGSGWQGQDEQRDGNKGLMCMFGESIRITSKPEGTHGMLHSVTV